MSEASDRTVAFIANLIPLYTHITGVAVYDPAPIYPCWEETLRGATKAFNSSSILTAAGGLSEAM